MLQPGWTGRRVSVRRVVERAADGRLLQGDVVGTLVELDAQTAVVGTGDRLVEVPTALITAARLVPPSSREELDLQYVAARALRPSDTLELDGWLLRADDARPRRVNSVLPHAQLRLPLDEALDRAGAWYAARDKPVLVQVPYPARRLLDAALGERDWRYEAPADVLVAGLDRLPPPDPTAVRVDAAPDAAWLDLTGSGAETGAGPGAETTDGTAALLTRHDRAAFASVRSPAGEVLAAARGSVDDGWLGLTGVIVVPAARRRGLAGRVTAALAGWGREHGAQRAFLQVESDNAAALALYAGLGFVTHHRYHYRRGPGRARR